MPVFRVSGATGQAPTTSYFGYVPDKYTMLLPTYMGLNDPAASACYLQYVAANLLNVFQIWNLSFGGGSNTPTATFTDFITAPDGTTNTMQRLAEVTTNTQHFAQAGSLGVGPVQGVLRFAGFFKSAGRRIILNINNGAITFSSGLPIGGTGCKAIFDLAGGQVGVAAATYGAQASQWRAVGQGIVPYGNGVYLCYVDAFIDNRTIGAAADSGQSSTNVFCSVYLDNGTGTNIESSTYAGDGTSGTYGWRMNLMPVTAYRISQTVLFDDFLNTNTIDITNSYAPGFNWYSGGGWHYVQNGSESIFGIQYTVSGSAVNFLPASGDVNGFSNPVTLRSAAPVNQHTQNGATIGNAWAPPYMIETRSKFQYTVGRPDKNGSATWGWTLEWVNGMIQFTATGDGTPNNPPIGIAGINGSLVGHEYDINEYDTASQGGHFGYVPSANYLHYEQAGISGTPDGDTSNQGPTNEVQAALNSPQWVGGAGTTVTYQSSTETVFNLSDSTFYQATATSNNVQPPNASFWRSNQPLNGVVTPVYFDMNQYHTYTYLRVPYLSGNGVVNNKDPNTNTTTPGAILVFFDGIFCHANPVYAPWSNVANPYCCLNDYQHFLINHGGSFGAGSGAISTFSVDFVRVSQ